MRIFASILLLFSFGQVTINTKCFQIVHFRAIMQTHTRLTGGRRAKTTIRGDDHGSRILECLGILTA